MNNQQLRIEVLLEEVVRRKASDLHLQVGIPPMLRIDGALVPIAGFNPLDEAGVETLVFAILDQDQRQILLKDKEFDFSFAFGTLGRFRVNAFHERGNIAAALRLIDYRARYAKYCTRFCQLSARTRAYYRPNWVG
jgi:twitching motility protein PilT